MQDQHDLDFFPIAYRFLSQIEIIVEFFFDSEHLFKKELVVLSGCVLLYTAALLHPIQLLLVKLPSHYATMLVIHATRAGLYQHTLFNESW